MEVELTRIVLGETVDNKSILSVLQSCRFRLAIRNAMVDFIANKLFREKQGRQ